MPCSRPRWQLASILARQGVVTAIGFDVLQRPRCERTFARPPKPGLLVSDRPNAP
jgi:hypothetical protein